MLGVVLLLGGPLTGMNGADQAGSPKAVEVLELHGSLEGQPFWARLLGPEARFEGHRILQVVYTPPTPEVLDGAQLTDCPFVLLDDAFHIIGWNGRDTASAAYSLSKPNRYKVSRDVQVGDEKSRHSEGIIRVVPSEVAWDLHLAPILLALAWHANSTGNEPLVDLFGPRWQDKLTISWKGDHVSIAGVDWLVQAEPNGLLHDIHDAGGKVLLTVDGRP